MCVLFIWFGFFVLCVCVLCLCFPNFPWESFLLWPTDLEACGLVCQYLEIFLLSVFNFYFDSIVVRAHIPYDFYSSHFFLEVCFITQDIFCMFCGLLRGMCILPSLGRVSSKFNCITLVGGYFSGFRVLCWQFSSQNSDNMNFSSFVIISQVPELLFIPFFSVCFLSVAWNRDYFTSSFPMWMPFISFSCQLLWPKRPIHELLRNKRIPIWGIE